eukprot:7811-Heterococcus_DN1.PRE.1
MIAMLRDSSLTVILVCHSNYNYEVLSSRRARHLHLHNTTMRCYIEQACEAFAPTLNYEAYSKSTPIAAMRKSIM